MTKKHILIVGGTGFIGYHLSKRCLKNRWFVTSISTKQPLKSRFLRGVQYIIVNISKKKEPMKEHEKFRNIKDKYEKHFSEKPAK
mgnify:CR=1 FL=1